MGRKILETERLILEELDQNRFDELFSLLSNPIVHEFFPKALNREESIDFLDGGQKRQKNDGISFWAVFNKDNSEMIGICGLFKQIVDENKEVEVGYRINDKYWGKGYGTEAIAGCIKYAKEILGLESVISLILSDNKKSIRVAIKNGLKWEKDSMVHDKIHQVYRIKLDN